MNLEYINTITEALRGNEMSAREIKRILDELANEIFEQKENITSQEYIELMETVWRFRTLLNYGLEPNPGA